VQRVVLHHTYIGGSTFDVSGMGNHGHPVDVSPGSGPTSGSYAFAASTSGISVETSPSLQNLRSIRIRMKFRTPAWDNQRRNLMEGYLSFAFFLGASGTLEGTIVDAAGNWSGLSAGGVIAPGQWHEVEMVHDGISRMALRVDGQLVAARDDVVGQVRAVGPLGLTIGRWPDANEYVYKGHIGELQLWRDEPVETLLDLLDKCCSNDRAALAGLLISLQNAGVSWRYVMAAARGGYQALVQVAAAAIANGDAAELDSIAQRARVAVLRRDRSALLSLRARLTAVGAFADGSTDRQAFDREISRAARRLGLKESEVVAVLHALCLGYLLQPDTDRDARPSDVRPSPLLDAGAWDDVATPEPWPSASAEPD
jgi:hypothetical protein